MGRHKLYQNRNKRKCVLRACNECRRKHASCDGQMPCACCKDSGTECEYSLLSKATYQNTRMIKISKKRVKREDNEMSMTEFIMWLQRDPYLGNHSYWS